MDMTFNNSNNFELDINILKLLTQNSFDTILIIGIDEKVKFVSDSVEKLNGYKSSERKGQLFHEFIHPDDIEFVLTEFRLRRKKTIKVEFRLKHKDGSWVWVESIAQDFSQHPLIKGIIVNSRNITERKQAEEKIRAEEERFRLMINNSNDAFVLLDQAGTQKFISDSVELITGYTKEEVNQNFAEFIHPDDIGVVQVEFAKTLSDTKNKYTVQYRHKHKEKGWVCLEAVAQNYLNHPALNSIVVNVRDITEKKQSESQIRRQIAVITQSPSIIVMTDTAGNITYVNKSFEKSTGYISCNILGVNTRILKSGKHSKEFYKNIWETIESGQHWKGELYNRRKDGSFFWEKVDIFPAIDKDNNITGYIKTSEDITEKKKIETELQKSELKYRSIFDNSKSPMLIIETETANVFDANTAAINFYGYTRNQFLALNISDINILPLKVIKEKMASAIKGNSNEFLFQHKLANGDIKDVRLYSSTIEIDNKDYLYIIIHDITRELHAEQTLKVFFENAKDAIFVAEADGGKILNTNKAAENLTGYRQDEIIGMYQSQLYPEELLEASKTELESSKGFKLNFGHTLVQHKNGDRIPVEITSNIINYGGEKYMYSIFRNITERKLAERIIKEKQGHLSISQRLAKMGSWELNTNTLEITLSVEHQIMLGKKPVRQSMKLFDYAEKYVISDDIAIIRDRLAYAIKNVTNRKYSDNFEYRIKSKNNNIRHLTVISRLKSKNIVYGVTQDITEIKKSRKELEEANITKDRFISVLGHDLKSPFNSLIGFSDLLVNHFDKFDQQKIKKIIYNINQTSKQTYDLLINLLEWSKSRTNKTVFYPILHNLFDLVKDVCDFTKTIVDSKQINTNIFIEQNIEIIADKEMLKTVIRNLLNNAVKFTKEHGSITISASQNKDNTTIEIVDTGTGMNDETVKSLFKIGEITSQKGTKGEKGTGLGLLICKEFVNKHKGEIIVESKVGFGSKFKIVLPRIIDTIQ